MENVVSQSEFWQTPVALSPFIINCLWGIWCYNFTYNPIGILFVMFLGALSWTIMEYLLHRYFFHCEDSWLYYVPHHKLTFYMHFIIHGVHHAFPMEKNRVGFPPLSGLAFVWLPIIHPTL